MTALSLLIRRLGTTPGAAWRIVALAAALIPAGAASHAAAQSEAPGEYQIKAAFLYNFAKFIQWPEAAFDGSGAPFRLCVVGAEPFVSVRETLIGKAIGGRRVEVQRVDAAASTQGCQMLFVGATDSATAEPALRDATGHAVTVGETGDFIRRGGLINLKTVDNKVRFEIDRTAGERSGFRFSSQLLKLATIVEQKD